MLESSKLSPGSQTHVCDVYSNTAWENDFCFPGQDRLAIELGVASQSANSYIKELESKEFISIKRGRQGKPNIHTLINCGL